MPCQAFGVETEQTPKKSRYTDNATPHCGKLETFAHASPDHPECCRAFAGRAGIVRNPSPPCRRIRSGARLLVRFVARGQAGPDSDYDLMIIVPDDAPPEKRRSRLAYQVMRGTGTAADVLVWLKSDFERRARVVCSLPATVLREGKLLYGR